MTIPALVQDVQDAQLKTAWKKTYADIDQASKRLILDNAGSLKEILSSDIQTKDLYTKYLNYTRSCNYPNSLGNCWAQAGQTKWITGTPGSAEWWNNAGLALNNGTLLNFVYRDTNCITRCAEIDIDVNGLKGPNTFGKDIYAIHVMKNSIKPFGFQGDSYDAVNDCNPAISTAKGYGCSALYIYK